MSKYQGPASYRKGFTRSKDWLSNIRPHHSTLPVNNSLIAYSGSRYAKTSAIALDIINEKFTVKNYVSGGSEKLPSSDSN